MSPAVCCSVLQCVAVCCRVLQCVAVCCSVLQCVAICCSVLQCVAVCCSVLHWCVAVWCSVLQCVTAWHEYWAKGMSVAYIYYSIMPHSKRRWGSIIVTVSKSPKCGLLSDFVCLFCLFGFFFLLYVSFVRLFCWFASLTENTSERIHKIWPVVWFCMSLLYVSFVFLFCTSLLLVRLPDREH